jgi:hypothetical protein
VKLHLWFEPDGALPLPDRAGPDNYSVDLLDAAAPVRGTLWVKGMDAPIEVKGTLATTHTWMEQSESELALRRIEFFSLQADTSFYLLDVTTPKGKRTSWLVLRRGGRVIHSSDRFELKLTDPPSGASDYPVPAALSVKSPELEGEIRLREVMLSHNPLEALPYAFRILLSFKTRPRRIWADSAFEMRFKAGPERPPTTLVGSGITTVTFLNPVPAEMSSRRLRRPGA